MLSSELDLVLLASGLTNGQSVEASFAYVPDDGSTGKNVGASKVTVRNGMARFVTDYDECTAVDGVPLSRPGHIHAWVHSAGTGFDGPPLETPDGEASINIPVG